MATLNTWLAAQEWSEERQFLRASSAELLTGTGKAVLVLAATVYPELTGLAGLGHILSDIASKGPTGHRANRSSVW